MSSLDELYSVIRGSDLDRDGMYLEVQDRSDRSVLMEIFYSDVDGAMTLNSLRSDLPVALVEWAIEKAKRLLPPVSDGDKPQDVA